MQDESEFDTQTETPPAPSVPRKARQNGTDASKPAVKAKAAPKAKKAASKAPKPAVKAKTKGKATVKAKTKAPAKAKAKAATPLDDFGFRVGSKKSQAAAMYASKKGATLQEVADKLDSVQLNLLSDLESRGFKVTKVKEDGDGKRQVSRYFLKAK